jgi:hypothetical protein
VRLRSCPDARPVARDAEPVLLPLLLLALVVVEMAGTVAVEVTDDVDGRRNCALLSECVDDGVGGTFEEVPKTPEAAPEEVVVVGETS